MTDRLPVPGPSVVPEVPVEVRGSGGSSVRAGVSEVRDLEGWWLALLWVADADGLVRFREVAPAAGPPADPPLARLGPAIAGALSGMILEEGGRQMIRLRLGVAPEDDARPWEAPLIVVSGFRWEPMRAATMTPEAIAAGALDAFRRAVEGLGRRS